MKRLFMILLASVLLCCHSSVAQNKDALAQVIRGDLSRYVIKTMDSYTQSNPIGVINGALDRFYAKTDYCLIVIGSTQFLCVNDDKVEIKSLKDLINAGDNVDSYLWAFTAPQGNDSKMQIFNKSAGTKMLLGCVNPEGYAGLTSKKSYFYYDSNLGAIYTKYSKATKYLSTNGFVDYDVLHDAANPSLKDVIQSCDFRVVPLPSRGEYGEKIPVLDDIIKKWNAACKKSAESMPFKLTTIIDGKFADDTEWYLIGTEWNSYINNDLGISSGTIKDISSYLWTFVKGETEGAFYIYNKKTGTNCNYAQSQYHQRLQNIQFYYTEDGEFKDLCFGILHNDVVNLDAYFSHKKFTFIPSYDEKVKILEKSIARAKAADEEYEENRRAKKEQERQQAIKAKKQAYNQMIATVGKANFDMLMANKMPKGISLKQLDAYAKYVNYYYEETEHHIGFQQITDSSWDVTLVRSNNAEKPEDGVCYFNSYRIYVANGRVAAYTVLHYR